MVFEKLKEVFAEMMEGEGQADYDVSAITLDSHLRDDLHFTSLNILWMAFGIEQAFGVDVSEIDVTKIVRVGDIVEYIEERQK